MKKLSIFLLLLAFSPIAILAQMGPQFKEKEVYRSDDVVFRQIDEHTWLGSGNLMASESLYLIEGNDRAILLDAGTKIADLDKIVASLTKKPVTLIATHVHPDHTGSAIHYFPEMYLNAADTVNIPSIMPDYKGELKFLKDREIIDLGGRKIEVVFTPGHTPGSTSFIDKEAGYGFSADAFGSGNLLLTLDFSTLLATCEKMNAIIENYGLTKLYPGHYFGVNVETPQRVKDMITLSKNVLSGKVKGEERANATLGLNLVVSDYGVRINYNAAQIK
ncbi:MAG: MBL fold metallo-hydrolase [Tannerellaceae bacterium]|jgi:glyoxylase-like metal-dependent hydrolase (beta-lactamase superfamily II)|nr:MBL fold metallo-hydrolase [Tannerellaceae bacterium]